MPAQEHAWDNVSIAHPWRFKLFADVRITEFALVETAYTVIRLCQAFERIECRAETSAWRESFSPLCHNFGGAKVALYAKK